MGNMGLPYISKCGLGKYKIYKNMGLPYISKCGLEKFWRDNWRVERRIIYVIVMLYVTSWDGGVLEYIMLLLYNVSPV